MDNSEASLHTWIPVLLKAAHIKESKHLKFLFFTVLDRLKLLSEKANVDNLGFHTVAWGWRESSCSLPHSSN